MASGVDEHNNLDDNWLQVEKEVACSFCKESKKNVPRSNSKPAEKNAAEARYGFLAYMLQNHE